MESKRFQNKTVVVTGGGTGIGEAIAIKFAQEGAKVAVHNRSLDHAEDTVKKIQEIGGIAKA